jgi:hypothetical protein
MNNVTSASRTTKPTAAVTQKSGDESISKGSIDLVVVPRGSGESLQADAPEPS